MTNGFGEPPPGMSLRYIVAASIAFVAIVGCLMNISVAIGMFRIRSFRNAFGLLTLTQALSNFGVLFIFLVWCAPTVITNVPDSWDTVNRYMGRFSLFFQTSSFHTSLFLSINRFTAITFPTKYRKYFTNRNTYFIIAFVLFVSFLYWSVYFIDSCAFTFDGDDFLWSFSDTPCGNALGFYIDLIYNCGVFVIVAGLDAITVMKLHFANSRLFDVTYQTTTQANKKRNNKERMLFIQGVLSSLLYGLTLVCFHVIAPMAKSRIQLFLPTTMGYELAHAGGGVILVLFNSEIRRRITRPLRLFHPDSSTEGTSQKQTRSAMSTSRVTAVAKKQRDLALPYA